MWLSKTVAALLFLTLIACTGEVGDLPPAGDGCPDSATFDGLTAADAGGKDTANKDTGKQDSAKKDTGSKDTGKQDSAKKDTTPADPSAYLHANVWSTWWNDRTRCGAERTFLRICQKRASGSCSLYQQAVAACNPSTIVYGQVGPEKQSEPLCQQSKYPSVVRRVVKLALSNPQLSRKLIGTALAHPRAAKKVIGWMVKHPKLAQKIIKRLLKNPAAARKLASKLRNRQ